MRRFNERGEIINEEENRNLAPQVTANQPRRVQGPQTQNPLLYVVIGIAVLLFLSYLLNANQSGTSPSSDAAPVYSSNNQDSGGEQASSGSMNQSTYTEAPAQPTEYQPPAVAYSCSGATPFPPEVAVGDVVHVCTQHDNLIARKSAEQSSKELFRMPPGTKLRIIDGPVCADNNTWWRIELAAGTRVRKGSANAPLYALSGDTYAWVREGGDPVDVSFICRE